MTRKRIYEYATEWGVGAQAILAQLEKMGVNGKKPQSALSSEEAEKVKVRLGLVSPPPPQAGKERLVAERVVVQAVEGAAATMTTKEQVIERRVGTGVIRRRTTRTEVPREPVGQEQKPAQTEHPGPEASTSSATTPAVMFEVPSSPEPLLPIELPPIELPPGAVSLKSPRPHAEMQGSVPLQAAGPSRILGRVDLRKTVPVPPPQPRPQASRASVTPAKQGGGTVVAAVPKTQGHNRKVVHLPAVRKLNERESSFLRAMNKGQVPPKLGQQQPVLTLPKASKRVIKVTEVITVGELAKAMGVKATAVISKLFGLGMMATINQTLDVDTATLAAAEFGYTIENVAFDVDTLLSSDAGAPSGGERVPRAPVVTIMGHVDHGKTSLLDAIRHTNVTARETGGITQHIGAYEVKVNGRKITFLDTPGHEAFTAMRARGARVTDIVVLVVAADDGVMLQTIEAMNHARAAGVPFVVAITKIDKSEADVERVKKALASYKVVSEEWGGDTIVVPVSAKTGEGIPALLDMLLLQADVLELTVSLLPSAKGTVIEAKLEKGRGPVATVLVQEGVLKVGHACVCGTQYGRVRALFNSDGQRVTEATPAMPVEVLGLTGVPAAGETLVVTGDEIHARQVAEHRQGKQRVATLSTHRKFSLADLAQARMEQKELRIVLKADVQGSIEALSDALYQLATDEVTLNILHASVGGISESDVLLAAASRGLIVGFHVRPEAKAAKLAEREGIEIRLYEIIYEVLADVRAALEGLLTPVLQEKFLGRVEVRQVFTIPQIGVIAGSIVKEGKITRGAQVRLLRDQAVVYQGRVTSLRRFKDDVREVLAGYECGVGLEHCHDMKAGDVLEAFEVEQVTRRLESRPHPVPIRLSA